MTRCFFFVSSAGSDAQLDVCGETIHNPKTRIVGGVEAPEGGWPWQVVVLHDQSFCGGTLITNQWVLTAAQCVQSTAGLIVVFGTNTLNPVSNTSKVFYVSNVVVHPGYKSGSFEHDIALLQLTSPVELEDLIKPVCLAEEDSTFGEGTVFWTTGWGYIDTDTVLPAPHPLKEVSLPLVSNEECDKIYHGVTDNMMCAGGEPGRGPCIGDGGGPLMLEVDGQWVQVGVMSFISVAGCAQGGIPAGFTRVSRYQQWISSNLHGLQPGFVYAGSPGLAPGLALLLGAALVLSSVLVHS
ncbi:uncharacterized protein V6R79_017192 [Siganus canaliculatus]